VHRHRSTRRRPAPEGGQAVPLLVGAVALAGALVLGLVHHGATALDAARARTAADAAALAGAAEGAESARRLAAANGATVVEVAAVGDDVVVTVRVGRASATARARREGTWCDVETGEGPAISYTSPPCPSSQG